MGFYIFCFQETGGWTLLLQWIKLLYKDQIAKNQYTGCHFTKINIRCGVRQGCPLSPLFLILVIEMLAVAVKQCSDIPSVSIESIEHKISLYAEDIVLFLQQTVIGSLTALNKLLNLFLVASGYKINETKFILMGLGNSIQ